MPAAPHRSTDPHRSTAALVTGCSSGIGRATALRLLDVGYPVFATARRPESLDALAAAGAVPLRLDVTDEDSMREAVEKVEAEHGAVGVLVNNAGYGQQGPVEEVPLDVMRRQFETNVFGLARLTQLALPGMRAQRWGRVVNISSVGGRVVFPGGGVYHASKYAVEALSDALRHEVRGFGVRVSLVEPGPVRSRFEETTLQSLAGTSDPDSPYADFRAALGARISSAYTEKGLGARWMASSNEDVAAVVTKAVRSSHPRARYVVGGMARSLLTLRRLLPDSALDAVLRTQFPVPKGVDA